MKLISRLVQTLSDCYTAFKVGPVCVPKPRLLERLAKVDLLKVEDA